MFSYYANFILGFINKDPKFCNWTNETNPEKVLQGNKKHKSMFDSQCDKYKDGGSKNIDLIHKVFSLKCSWVRRFCNEIYLDWKFISYITLRIIRQRI